MKTSTKVVGMKSDIIGRVRNTALAKTNVLLPLFEAIVNSIQAIEDIMPLSKGNIDVIIHRDIGEFRSQKEEQDQQTESFPIVSFSIHDNGVGFTEKNFDSFQTADSRSKEERGGKGVGRFLWLKAFQNIHIRSTFNEDDKIRFREFDFVLVESGIRNYEEDDLQKGAIGTHVRLNNPRKGYAQYIPKQAGTIADKILDHCLIYFLSKDCPEITLKDPADEITINLKDRFNEGIKEHSTNEKLTIKDAEFNLKSLHLRSSSTREHMVHLCAHSREVFNIPLKRHLPELANQKLSDEGGNEFILSTYVSGPYLDTNVNSERTDFGFPDEPDGFGDLALSEIVEGVVWHIQDQFEETLTKLEQQKIERIREFIGCENYRYRSLLTHGQKFLKDIPPGLSDEKLDLALHKALGQFEIQLKRDGKKYLESNTSEKDNPEYEAAFQKYVEKVSAYGQSKLADYVISRKIILNLLEQAQRRKDDGKYCKEEEIHNLIFPMRVSSDDIDPTQQNLWIVDEKLSYHYYLASDLRFDGMEPLNIDNNRRPDIIVINPTPDRPAAFVEGEFPFSSIVIVELKRPERKDYAKDDNPIQQVWDYIEILRSGKAMDKDMETIRIDENTRFYCYILANLTPKLEKMCRGASLDPTSDNMGYYGFNSYYNAYIEIIDFKKMISDAKKRNRVLFDKLGLPQ